MKKQLLSIAGKCTSILSVLAIVLLANTNAHAQFSGHFAPNKWALTLRITADSGYIGSVNTASAPNSISLSSGNDMRAHDGYSLSYTVYTVSIPSSGQLSFDWFYTTPDGAGEDFPMYSINGVLHDFATYNKNGTTVQSGRVNSIAVSANDQFALVMATSDAAAGGATTTFSNFTFLSDTPLPIVLGDFVARVSEDGNIIHWTTLKEDVGDCFVLERSNNGYTFEQIAEVKGSSKASSYTYTDREAPRDANTFYRLKLVHADGSSYYSKVESVRRIVQSEAKLELILFPNPASEMLLLKMDENYLGGKISIINLQGVVQYSVEVVDMQQEIDISNLLNGSYVVVVQHNELINQAVLLKQ